MSVFDTLAPRQPTVEQGAHRVKRTLAQSTQQIEIALSQVRQIIELHGADKIRVALGSDQGEVIRLYQTLKSLVEQNKQGSSVPDLPN
jgi:hypothetical protein